MGSGTVGVGEGAHGGFGYRGVGESGARIKDAMIWRAAARERTMPVSVSCSSAQCARTEYSKMAFILKRSHVFHVIPLSCEIVQCSPCERQPR